MSMTDHQREYFHSGNGPSFVYGYLGPVVFRTLENNRTLGNRIFDLGAGDGEFAAMMTQRGYEVTGIDPSESGIAHANAKWPKIALFNGSSDDDLAAQYGTFPFVVSLEVVEHVFAPHAFLRRIHSLLAPNGIAIVSTPYHGYVKNLALALSGGFDKHFTVKDTGGHIKFFSVRTLSAMMIECGLSPVSVDRVGRIPPLAKSMVIVARRI